MPSFGTTRRSGGASRGLAARVRLAVDDAGAGFASLRHILELDPAFVKLDISLIRGIDRDPAKQALVAGMRHFARTTKRRLIAEGVETEAEARTLAELDVRLVQGYLIRPTGAACPAVDREARGQRSLTLRHRHDGVRWLVFMSGCGDEGCEHVPLALTEWRLIPSSSRMCV